MTAVLFITFLAAGIACWATYGVILVWHILPYMEKRMPKPKGLAGVFAVNDAIREYWRIDDPAERKVKAFVRALRIGFSLAVLVVVFVIIMLFAARER